MRTRALASLPLLLAAGAAFAACASTVVGNPTTSSTSSSGATSGPGTGGAVATSTANVGTGGSTQVTTVSTSVGTGGASSSTAGSGGGPVGDTRPPGHPAAPFDPYGTGSVTFAVSKLYMGNTDRDGTSDPSNGWKQYGFDIDDKISTAASTDLCQTQDNAPKNNVYPDGVGGIDNSFGKNILPILLGLSSAFAQKQNDAITTGKTTLLLDLQSLGTGSKFDPLAGRLYPGADLGHPPLFDGTDAWPVDPAGLTVATDVTSAKVQFPSGYMNADTWVAQGQGGVPFTLTDGNIQIPLLIQDAVIAMTLDPTHTHVTNGTISGVVSTAAFVASLKQAAGTFDPTLCMGPTIDSISAQIAQASDILQDGSQDASKVCDGISIGLGFDAERVLLGPIGPAQPPPPHPCP